VKWIDQYNPGTGKWNADRPELLSIPGDNDQNYGGRGFPGVALSGKSDRVLIAGGTTARLVGQTQTVGGVTVTKGPFEVQGQGPPRGSTLLFDPSTNEFQTVDELSLPRSLPLAAPLDSIFGRRAVVIGGESTYEDAPVYHAERFFDIFSFIHYWSSLPWEPYPTWPDYFPRMGTALTDGSILTWSSIWFEDEPEFGGTEESLRVAKRLRRSWWEWWT
jgi:hypothetical protein